MISEHSNLACGRSLRQASIRRPWPALERGRQLRSLFSLVSGLWSLVSGLWSCLLWPVFAGEQQAILDHTAQGARSRALGARFVLPGSHLPKWAG